MSATDAAPLRIAMWSGPRNISTALMRAFESRADTSVVDEPFYAAYLADTGADHPMREAVIEAGETDPARVAAALLGPAPEGAAVFYQKHMAHHMRPRFGLRWTTYVTNAFLIRPPEAVLASYAEKRAGPTLDDIGVVQQAELFEMAADRLGHAPPVVLASDVLAAPGPMLATLCAALGIAFDQAMLVWPEGRRASDGIWAEHWYQSVESSTGFSAPRAEPGFDKLDDALKPIADAARPHYERLFAHRLTLAA